MKTLWSVVVLLAAAGAAQETAFRQKPVAERKGERVQIAFALAKPSDVEVTVLNASGKPVRHLAAGLAGAGQAPAPLQAGLAQQLEWDGKDDEGKPAAGGPFKIRVGAGMQAGLGRILGGDPYQIGQVCGLTTDKEGQVYVMHNSYGKGSDGPLHIQIFDRGGKYVRTILPAPADMPLEKVEHFGAARKEDGSWYPFNHWARFPHLALFGQRSKGGFAVWMANVVTDDGKLLLYTPHTVYWMGKDGSITREGIAGVSIWPKDKKAIGYSRCGPVRLVPSPDGKYCYISGIAAGAVPGCGGTGPLPEWPDGRIYRMEAATAGSAQPFADVKDAKGVANYKWTSAHGAAVDAEGRLYVCDRANQCVAVFDTAGKQAASVPVANPDYVIVHRKTGELFVLCIEQVNGKPARAALKKFAAPAAGGKELASLDLTGKLSAPCIAADTSQAQAVVWLADNGQLLRIEDQGGAFAIAENLCNRAKDPLPAADRMAIDAEREEVYINDAWAGLYRYNGLTGKGEKLPFGGMDLDVGGDGNLYILGAAGGGEPWMGFKRLTRDGKPAPFPAWSGKHENKDYHYGRFGAGYSAKGVCVAPDGKTYMLDMGAWNDYWVTVYDKDGKFLGGPQAKGAVKARAEGGLINGVSTSCGGIQVDRQGNIYIGVAGMPPGYQFPDGLDGKSPIHRELTGSVVKFSPAGGTFWSEALKTPRPSGTSLKLEVGSGKRELLAVGALRIFPGVSPTSTFGDCACRSPRFHLDEYGRLYVPDIVTFQVRVFDAAGNVLRTIGSYGNVDSTGSGSLVPKPEIAFAWPISVCLANRHLYVADVQNRRVTRVDLSYAEEVLCEVK